MKRIGILFGGENSFPGSLVEQINARNLDGLQAEFCPHRHGRGRQSEQAAALRGPHRSHLPRRSLLRAFLSTPRCTNRGPQQSLLGLGRRQVLQLRAGHEARCERPATVLLPHKQIPAGATDHSFRNLEYPLDWRQSLPPWRGGLPQAHRRRRLRDVYHVHSREEFFRAYDQTRDLCMVYQKAVDYNRLLPLLCRRPAEGAHHGLRPAPPARRALRPEPRAVLRTLLKRMRLDAVKLCRASATTSTRSSSPSRTAPPTHRLHEPRPRRPTCTPSARPNFDWDRQRSRRSGHR